MIQYGVTALRMKLVKSLLVANPPGIFSEHW